MKLVRAFLRVLVHRTADGGVEFGVTDESHGQNGQEGVYDRVPGPG